MGGLKELLDREAIRELVYRYCRAIDRRDFALLATLYHQDAIDDHSPYFCGPAVEFVAQLPRIMAVSRVTSHQPSRFDIETARAGGAVLGRADASDPSYDCLRLFPRGA